MSRPVALTILLVISWVATARAHRLDEYVQATAITLENDRVTLQLRLIAGVAVAPQLLSRLDSNQDGAITDSEQRRYAQTVAHDLSLTLDGKPMALQLVGSSLAQPAEIRRGMGGILLTFRASLPVDRSSHQLTLKNQHQRLQSIYLVNCLQPESPAIRIESQQRNDSQSVYQLKYTVGRPVLAAQPTKRPVDDTWSVLKTYCVWGVQHIVGSYGHLLFISVLVLGAASLWTLVKSARSLP